MSTTPDVIVKKSLLAEGGFILPFTLLLLTCSLLFSLLQWQQLLHLQQLSNRLWAKTLRMSQLETIATTLSETLPFIAPYDTLQGETSYQHRVIHYRAEGMGRFPCIKRPIHEQWFSTNHVSLQVWDALQPDYHVSLRIAQPIPLQACLDAPSRIIHRLILTIVNTP